MSFNSPQQYCPTSPSNVGHNEHCLPNNVVSALIANVDKSNGNQLTLERGGRILAINVGKYVGINSVIATGLITTLTR